MNHADLMALTADMPMKTIQVNGQDYLQRHFAGYSEDGGQWWYHRFLRADSERHLHTHPWNGTSVLVCGHYVEQLRPEGNKDATGDTMRQLLVGYVNQIWCHTLHRIVQVMPNTWTLLYIEPGRQPTWKFIADDGSETVMQASPEDWHKSYPSRRQMQGDQSAIKTSGYDLWAHLHHEHGLTLMDSELQEVVRLARAIP